MARLDLTVGDRTLVIDAQKRIWSTLYLEHNNETIKIGSHYLDDIISGLLVSFGTYYNKKTSELNGLEVFNVVCVMDPHAQVLGSKIESNIKLFFINFEGEHIPIFTLTPDDIERLTKQITKFMIEYKE